jgi:luciferase family oxidoreductase group 1
VTVQPCGAGVPQVWLLGSSDYSGALAARLGLRFAFAHFISSRASDVVMRGYRTHYQPSQREPAPVSLLCVLTICADTMAQAERLAATIDLRRLHMAKGIEAPIPTLEEVDAYAWSDIERAYAAQQRVRLVHGDPQTVREKLVRLAEAAQADELMLLTITGDYASRRRSYQLLAQEFQLQGSPSTLPAGISKSGR